jgi:CHAT domain-containing protein
MKRDRRPFDSELEALLEGGRIIPPAPDVVRARALARARATVAAATASVPAAAIPERGRGLRIAVAASVALVLGATGAAAALRGWIPHRPEPTPPSRAGAVPPARVSAPDLPALPTVAPEVSSIAKPHRPARSATAQESYAAELELLHRAQAAYTRRDFSDALVLLAEHGRGFPNGRLAEQREALRVRSLAASGRAEDARHAVGAFARRFPRSVLLQRLQETARTAE